MPRTEILTHVGLPLACWMAMVFGLTNCVKGNAPQGAQPAKLQEAPSCASAVNQLAFDLLERVAAERNVVLSPASVSSAMAMVYSGARGETARQIAHAMHFSVPPGRIHEAFAAFQSYKAEESREPLPAADRLGMSVKDFRGYGVLIDRVEANSAAAQTGLAPRDLLLAIDGNPVRKEADFAEAVERLGGVAELQWYSFARGRVERQQVELEAEPSMTLQIINGAWLQQGYRTNPAYVDLIRTAYDGHVALVDFRKGGDAPRQAINNWVAQETNGQIQELLDASAVTPDSRLILTNAVWFRGEWSSPFRNAATIAWQRLPGATEPQDPVPAMSQVGRFRHAQTEGGQILELPYKGSTLALMILLPDSTVDWAQFRRELTVAAFTKALADLQPQHARVTMPKFRIDAKATLEEVLEKRMPLPFSDDADFQGISPAGDLKISAVRHQAYIDVHEKGTEAGAATAVGTIIKSVPAVDFVADRPFLFFLVDRESGVILFIGQLVAPEILTEL